MSGGIVFGDFDPEDVFDVHDSVEAILSNLRSRLLWIIERSSTIEEAEFLARAWRLFDDLDYARLRIAKRLLDKLDPASDPR